MLILELRPRRLRVQTIIVHLTIGLCVIGPASAAELLSTATPDSRPSLWIVTLGSYAAIEPTNEGAKSYHWSSHPIFNFRKSDGRDWLQLPNDGYDFEFIETDQFRAGPVVSGRLTGSPTATDRGLRDFGSFALSFEAGVFAEYWPFDWLRARVEVRSAVFGGSGVEADLAADVVWKPNERWALNAGPRLSFADAALMGTYYTVSAQQAVVSGLTPFVAQSGLKSYGLGTGFKYKLTPQLNALGFVEYQRISGSAADSPLVAVRGTPDQFSFGLGLSYDFRLD